MPNSYSVDEVKRTFQANLDNVLRVTTRNGNIFTLQLDHEVDHETYNETGRWLTWVVAAVSGEQRNFDKLFKPGSGLDIYEADVIEIRSQDGKDIHYREAPNKQVNKGQG